MFNLKKVNLISLRILCTFAVSIYFGLFGNIFTIKNAYSREQISNDFNKENQLKSSYLLGAGDEIFLSFMGIDIYSRKYEVDVNGNINLPELGEYKVAGLTKAELERDLEQAYDKYIINPILKVFITSYRDISIYIDGEVKLPGLYKFEIQNKNESSKMSTKLVTLFDSIQRGGGLTNYADLSDIEIIRNNSKSQGGGKIKANVNLLKLIENGDQSQNLNLNDGDFIFIKKSKNMIKEQIIAINKTNLTPNILTIFITGNVVTRGRIETKKGSSLNQAIATAGGKKILTGRIEYLSFNDDGSTEKRLFNYDSNANINSYKNPILNDGDVINVRKSILGNTTEVLREVSSPLFSGFGLYKLFSD